MPVNGNVPVQRSVLPEGIAGVDATVRKMVEMAHSKYGSKSAKIRALAIDIVRDAGIKDKDYYGEMIAIHNWVRDNIRYVKDPIGQETLSYPEETAFNSRAGDCDDLSTLEMALLGSIGIESFPVVVGMFPGHFSHVYIHGKVPAGKGRFAGKIIPLDPIMKDWPAGREATKIKAKKTYPHLSNPLTMNGLPMGDLGDYVAAPSYLDTEDSHASMLVVPDQQASNVHADKTVAIASRVNMPFEGIDGMFGPVRPTGDNFTETSAGDGGTIVQSGGQVVPKGFIRREPDLREVMAMRPATAEQLGPRGPIFARRADDEEQKLKSKKPQRMNTLAHELQQDRLVRGAIVRETVGSKRYDMPTVQQNLRMQRGLVANPVRRMTKKEVIVLNSVPLDRLGTPPRPLPTIGEALAAAESELAGLGNLAAVWKQKIAERQPMAIREDIQAKIAAATARIKELEKKILALRQQMRDLPEPKADEVRAVAVSQAVAIDREKQIEGLQSKIDGVQREIAALHAMAPGGFKAFAVRARINGLQQQLAQYRALMERMQAPATPVNGLGEGFVDLIKKPIVWGPLVAFVGVFALRMYLKKRRAAAPV